ncbi:MarR family transcriptional regulator [Candidatus Lucifugimonas marina]|uniref:MarR family transcriptional regulator n=2 Tax=Candidatus Lucifugimonas marina TaxID=3038979 RepID=A0AAJ5ZEL7_9CHLR|nr:MarR family transcriptional regulator [SAR202 cluster bacterium JH702]MDG0870690.1 MarR family transcriptional regulator [SAR202 cluster bacterium JH639]WFG34774.1 MarR family transcriptional regulator [SAR202 cluster bacterium JH545]WFG38714.1 MarR family transcriptional regulator [SAR202 cluster bacterium JH1073]
MFAMSIVVIINYFWRTSVKQRIEEGGMAKRKNISAAQAWEQALTSVSRLLQKFDSNMQDKAGVSVIWYDVLLHLHHAPEKKMRMQMLSKSLVLTRSGVTRLVDRIEKAGLVRREAAVEDRRGYYAILTDEGEEALAEAQEVHRKDIRTHFGARLDKAEQQAVFNLMSKLRFED